MEKMVEKSISNAVFCALKEALKRSKIKSGKDFLQLRKAEDEKQKLFAVVEVKKGNIDRLKLGVFLQAFVFALEKSGIKSEIEEKDDFFNVNVFLPSKIIPVNPEGKLTLKIDERKTSASCLLKPKKVYRHKVKVRFRDLDAMGHVSNNVFLVYLEEARVGFRNFLAGKSQAGLEFSSVVASHKIDYLAPIFLGEELYVEIFISHLTKRSYRFNYAIVNAKTKQIKAVASTQMVGYDYKNKKVKDIDKLFLSMAEDYVL